MSKKLTHEFVVLRTKCDRLESIKNLNLWGNDLEDISIIKNMPNLEVVSLSVNKIRTLKDFSYLKHLKELYLRKNSVSDINEVKYLANCPNLRILWLSDNPVADTKGYRSTVIKYLPQINKLDNDSPISLEEKEKAAEESSSLNYNYNNEDKSWDDVNDSKEEENVFESQNFNYDNVSNNQNFNNPQVYSNQKSEIYSNNEKNKKIKDKFNNQNNLNSNININSNINNNMNKKYSVNYDDPEAFVQKFDDMNIKYENLQRNIKRTNTTYETREREHSANNYEYKKPNNQNPSKYIPTKDTYENIVPANQNVNNTNRASNIVNCVIMLLKELNDSELELVKNEIDKKLSNI